MPIACPQCHSTFDPLSLKNALGCVSCYDAFEEYLGPMLARFHKGSKHLGKIPRKALDLATIRAQLHHLDTELSELVKAERFQDAGLVKNSIKDFTALMEELLNSSRKGE